ncbi:hypothetical protein B0H67DRAFT_649803 [Lasiosphaeris hirsuta]|uniref:Uncharacterized protein n=1 Tax=Lasiosphaeris hirsuta TaxID=260670 RepID=A0AA39ZXL8_9PEZI|nr:hypothetical protein B0H67DRAFT_649803 [Lasiosphaeris hirsuta]
MALEAEEYCPSDDSRSQPKDIQERPLQDEQNQQAENGPKQGEPRPSSGDRSLNGEISKMIASTSRRSAFLSILLFHLPPMAITAFFLALYLSSTQWDASAAELNALLYAAKVHETLIAISLSNILYHRLRYELLGSKGTVYGYLTSPFEIGNPLYLFSKTFRGAARSSWKLRSDIITTFLVVVCVLLAILASPSSGVVMLPNFDWWALTTASPAYASFRSRYPDSLAFLQPQDQLYPVQSDVDKVLFYISATASPITSGWLAMMNSLPSPGSRKFNPQRYISNLTINENLESMSVGYSQLPSQDANLTHNGRVVFATAPLPFLSQALVDNAVRWAEVSSSDVLIRVMAIDSAGQHSWKQPLVYMDCREGSELGDGTWAFDFPGGIFPPAELSLSVETPQEREGVAELVDIHDKLPFSISAALLVMDASTEAQLGYVRRRIPDLCLIGARWVDSAVWVNTPFLTARQSSVSTDPAQYLDGLGSGTVITLQADLLNNATVSVDFNNGTVEDQPILPHIEERCFRGQYFVSNASEPQRGVRGCVAAMATMILADILRSGPSWNSLPGHVLGRQGSDGEWTFHTELGTSVPYHDGEFTVVGLQFFSQTYAYRLQGVLTYLAMAVLILHFLMAWVQLLLLVFGDCWHSRAWADLGELIALGVATRTPDLLFDKTGGGVGGDKIWGVRTFVRAMAGSKEARLVFDMDGPGLLKEGVEKAERGKYKMGELINANEKYS